MLPDCDIRRDTIFAIVEEHHPVGRRQYKSKIVQRARKHIHSIWVHRLAGIEVKIGKVGHDLLGVVSLHALLELLDELLILARFFKLLYDLLQIP